MSDNIWQPVLKIILIDCSVAKRPDKVSPQGHIKYCIATIVCNCMQSQLNIAY